RNQLRAALDACALGADLASIPGGDTAYVGERGATLSGGQRLRVSLASIATLCLLDDPLTSLDAHTRDHVLHRCIHGLMRGNPRAAVVVT
ncbi:unnamed protein product, partial [Hapterophycus canaliculatus]